jgi:hypothetical protein
MNKAAAEIDPVGAGEACDLLTMQEVPKIKIKRSQPAAAPTPTVYNRD